MVTRISHLHSVTPNAKPRDMVAGQIGVNIPDKLLFVGDGSDTRTASDGTEILPAPDPARGFLEMALSGGSAANVSTANSVTAAAASPTDAELNTAFGTPNPKEGDIGVVEGGTNKGLYVYDGSAWVASPQQAGGGANALVNVIPVATVAAADTAATGLGTDRTEGDILVITDSTGLAAQAQLGGEDRQAPPATFSEGGPISYIYAGAGTGWIVLGAPSGDREYIKGPGIVLEVGANVTKIKANFAEAGDLSPGAIVGTSSKVLRADSNRSLHTLTNVSKINLFEVPGDKQSGLYVRDADVLDNNAPDAFKFVQVLSGGTF